MTVAEMKDRMTTREVTQWDEWFLLHDKAKEG